MQGAGTVANPYLVSTPQDLSEIRNNLSASFELTNHIDMSSFGNFSPIGSDTNNFIGNIDGKGHKIINLKIISKAPYTGFISYPSYGSIKNLGLENVYVESAAGHTGGLVGLNYFSKITNCFVTGTIKSTSTSSYTGGLVGRNFGAIEDCYTDCSVTSNGNYVGGFVGTFADNSSVISRCYAKSTITALPSATNVGGFYGSSNPNVPYKPIFNSNYFDSDLSGRKTNATTGVMAKSTAEMQSQATYSGWDFKTIWRMDGYPKLWSFSEVALPKQVTFTVSSFLNPIQSQVNNSKKIAREVKTHTNSILTNSERVLIALRAIESKVSSVDTNVSKSTRIVHNTTHRVQSYISPIYSSVYKKSKTIRRLLATVNSLEGSVDVQIPIGNKGINAYVSFIQNASATSVIVNPSAVQIIQNPSFGEVIT